MMALNQSQTLKVPLQSNLMISDLHSPTADL
jgi:hypothetical protein